jgi:hypothetical protein
MRRLAPSIDSQIGTEIAALHAADRERSATARRRAVERHQWDKARKSEGEEAAATLRRRYIAEVQPRLAAVPQTAIMQALQVSREYARDLARRGWVPHPRHFEALAELVGAVMPVPARLGCADRTTQRNPRKIIVTG